ncbi:hypothetical protein BJV74DRAFT_981875 [Russula compacta]|nr:hypothetical protein BJV74DRAFT_981875 [Russula compacta]
MFTPPPSPLPRSFPCTSPPVSSSSPSPPSSPQGSLTPALTLSSPPLKCDAHRKGPGTSMLTVQDRKRRIACYTALMVIVLPLVSFLVMLLTRFTSCPLLDLLPGPSPGIRVDLASGVNAHGIRYSAHVLHRRNIDVRAAPSDVPSPTSSGIAFPSTTSNSTNNPSKSVPTIPASPVLPTPFPQPFDTTLGSNFTTNSCQTFFTNMTQTLPFRQCRPFSFLSQTSSSFCWLAQSNLTALNIDIWGTCNTPVDADQCTANMGWFASELLVACSQEKSERNQMVLQALASLRTYSMMREVACLVDQNTSTYCYVEAASSSNPSDLYIYSLPFGVPLPANTTLSCSGCSESVMALFGEQANQTDGLEQTYSAAEDLATSKCGPTYAHTQSALASSSALPWIGDKPPPGLTLTLMFTLCGVLMGLF